MDKVKAVANPVQWAAVAASRWARGMASSHRWVKDVAKVEVATNPLRQVRDVAKVEVAMQPVKAEAVASPVQRVRSKSRVMDEVRASGRVKARNEVKVEVDAP